MKQIMAGLALAFAVAAMGCGGSQKPKTPAGPTCADVAANTEKQMIAEGQKKEVDMTALGALARDVINERCPADAWSADAIACLATATAEQIEACATKLTPEQNKALEDTMKQKMDRLSGDDETKGDEPPGAPAAGAAAPPRSKPPADPCGGDE